MEQVRYLGKLLSVSLKQLLGNRLDEFVFGQVVHFPVHLQCHQNTDEIPHESFVGQLLSLRVELLDHLLNGRVDFFLKLENGLPIVAATQFLVVCAETRCRPPDPSPCC